VKRVSAAVLILFAGMLMTASAWAGMATNSAQVQAQKHNQEKSRKDLKRMRKEQKKERKAQGKAARADKRTTSSHS